MLRVAVGTEIIGGQSGLRGEANQRSKPVEIGIETVLSEFNQHGCLVTRNFKIEFDANAEATLLLHRHHNVESSNDLVSDPAHASVISVLRKAYQHRIAATPEIEGAVAA